jgi:hypothetical protein
MKILVEVMDVGLRVGRARTVRGEMASYHRPRNNAVCADHLAGFFAQGLASPAIGFGQHNGGLCDQ